MIAKLIGQALFKFKHMCPSGCGAAAGYDAKPCKQTAGAGQKPDA